MNSGQGETGTRDSRNLGESLGTFRNLSRAMRWFEVRGLTSSDQPLGTYELIEQADLLPDAIAIRDNVLLTGSWESVYIVACDVINWKDR